VRQKREVLEHHAHRVAPQLDHLGFGGAQQILAVEQDLARRRLDQARQAPHERRLARARQPHDDEDLALADLEIDVAHGRDEPRARSVARSGSGPSRRRFRPRGGRTASRRRGRRVGCRAWARRRGRAPVKGAPDRGPGYWIHALQVDSLAAIQSATACSTVLPSRSTSVIIAPMSSFEIVKASIAA
jgi:hypothetical protein